MTRDGWIESADTLHTLVSRGGFLPHVATAAAFKVLLDSWRESVVNDGISPSVVVHDLKEVCHELRKLYTYLESDLPNVLEELAHVRPK